MRNNEKVLSFAAKQALEKNGFADRCDCRVISKRVEKDMKVIEKTSEMAQNLEKGGGALPSSFQWVADNCYLFRVQKNGVKKALYGLKNVQCGENRLPRFYLAFLDYLKSIDNPVDSDALFCFVESANMGNNPPTLRDFYSFSALFRAAVFARAAEICEVLNSKNPNAVSDSCARQYEGVVKSLHFLSTFDFSEIFELCEAEQVLKSDPNGTYDSMTDSTKQLYRDSLVLLSEKKKIPETELALEIVEKCRQAADEKGRHIGSYLVPKPRGGRLYLSALTLLTLGFTLLLLFVSPLCALLIFPIWECVRIVLDRVFARLYKSHCLPSLELSEIPDGNGVMVVITTLLSGQKSDKQVFDRLERIYHANGGKNVYFGVLCDLCDWESAVKSSDEAVFDYAKKRINALREKYGEVFFLFSRQRVYSKSDGCFMAYERKRGAVTSLCSLLCGDGDDFDDNGLKPCENLCKSIKYCITLDSDTNLPTGSVLKLAGAMLHPLNKPTIDREKRIVTDGYGIMQPKMAPCIESASRTIFSRIMCGAGGLDVYAGADSDLFQNIFGSGIFCGKGIFDKDAFHIVTTGKSAFAEDTVLSHDAIEGARLNCAQPNDVTLTDSFPKNELSYFKRSHRWIRGDVQNLVFTSRFVANKDGETVANHISPLSKFRLYDNVRRETLPIFVLVCILASVFSPQPTATILLYLSTLYIFLPFALDLFSSVFSPCRQCASRRFFSKGVYTGLWQSLIRSLLSLCALCKNAFVTFDALFRSGFRMLFTHRNMLEWVTAAQGDMASRDGLLGYVQKNILSAAVGVVIFLFSTDGYGKLVGFSWFLLPFVAYITSFSGKEKDGFSESDKKELSKYSEAMWHFFADNVTKEDNYLVPDNLQIFPDEFASHRTSPTNIGLSLVCTLAARDFGFINSHELYERLNGTLSTLERLEKYHGHLYNWYDTQTLSVLSPKYVSGVDSGNFVACLITVFEGVKDFVSEDSRLCEICARMERLTWQTDFDVIYNKRRQLFYLGISFDENGEKQYGDGCYDLLMSEARTLSYIAVAKRLVPVKHWQSLSRTLIKDGDRIGLASWTGTAFEYFMPSLFLPMINGSLSFEALQFALHAQKKTVAQYKNVSVWGISESGYFAFDSALNYQYKAFGVPLLALKRKSSDSLVISPYSTFLSLCCGKCGQLENLRRLKKFGAVGKYGFYEAVDFSPLRTGGIPTVVKSFMSHHFGMSLCACANACFDNIMQRRFMRNVYMSSAREILEERIPVDAVVGRERNEEALPDRPERSLAKAGRAVGNGRLEEPVCEVLSDGRLKIIAADNGYLEMSLGDTIINSAAEEKYGLCRSFFTFAKVGNKIFSLAPSPFRNENADYSFEVSPEKLCYKMKSGGVELAAEYTLDVSDAHIVRLRTSARLPKDLHENVTFAVAFEPVLRERNAHLSHPTFSQLFIGDKFSDGVLTFERRAREKDGKGFYLSLAVKDNDFEFCSRKDALFKNVLCGDDFRKIFEKPTNNETGACIFPYCLVKCRGKQSGGLVTSELVMAVSSSEKKALSSVKFSLGEGFEDCCKRQSEASALLAIGAGLHRESSADKLLPEEFLLTKCVYPERRTEETDFSDGINSLWKHGISGDYPIIVGNAQSSLAFSGLEKYVRAFMLLCLMGVRLDLVLLCSDSDLYSRPCRNEIMSGLERLGAAKVVGKNNGGIFVVDTGENGSSNGILSYAHGVIDLCDDGGTLCSDDKTELFRAPEILSHKPLNGDFAVKHGVFGKNCFTVDKAQTIKQPQSHVLSGRMLSTVVTHNTLGYTFSFNASERRITPFLNDVFEEKCGEYLFLRDGNRLFDLAAMSKSVTYSAGLAVYRGSVLGEEYTLSVFIPEKLPIKVMVLETDSDLDVEYYAKPVLGRFERQNHTVKFNIGGGFVRFFNPFSEYFTDYGFVCGTEKSLESADVVDADYEFCRGGRFDGYARAYFRRRTDGLKRVCIALGCAKNAEVEKLCSASLCDVDALKTSATDFSESFLPQMNALPKSDGTDVKSLSVMFDFWLPYQNGICRFLARSGFYQSGGAYGFRDQLQDCLTLMYSKPEMAGSHIIRAAAHQFEEGDVLHWWHPGTNDKTHSHKGVRTKCSDDYIWLPFVTAKYVKYTGDVGILDVPVRYLRADGLEEGKAESYISPEYSEIRESLYRHCLKGLSRAVRMTGVHGLPLIGNGDWSDGMNKIGIKGRGESVWLGMFLSMTLCEFSGVCERYDDYRSSHRLCEQGKALSEKTAENGFDIASGYYIRAFSDSGRAIGVFSETECKIDLLPQAFCAIANIGDRERMLSSLYKSYDMLFDRDVKILKLFAPAFAQYDEDVGYIMGYVSGIRENGGQYTHGAVWGSIGFFEGAKKLEKDSPDRKNLLRLGLETLLSLLPPLRMSDERLCESYGTEPYVLTGDIYSNPDHKGRGGWSWYTGAAGWLWREILEEFFCVVLCDVATPNASLTFTENVFDVPLAVGKGFTLKVRLKSCDADFEIEYVKGNRNSIAVNSKPSTQKISIFGLKGKIVVTSGDSVQ